MSLASFDRTSFDACRCEGNAFVRSCAIHGILAEEREAVCDYAGHTWAPAGGGLLICTTCEAEKWDD